MKLKVQAQHLQPGDKIGSGEEITGITINSTQWPSTKVRVYLMCWDKKIPDKLLTRAVLWGKYTMINVERK